MNNYNELINKPTINGKELIGEVEVSGLPKVTSEDVGKVPIVNDNGEWEVDKVSGLPEIDNSDNGNVLTANNSEWIASPPLDYNLSNTPTIAGFYTESSGGSIQKTPIYKLTFHGTDFIQTNHVIDLREYTDIHDVINFEGVLKMQLENGVEILPINLYSNTNEFCRPYYIKGFSDYNDGYPCIYLEGRLTNFTEYYITIYYI